MQYDEEFNFEIPAYTPAPSSVSSFPSTFRKRAASRQGRYSPYALAKRSIHQMNISYVDPAYVEANVELIRPATPLQDIGALLQPPQRGIWGFFRLVGFGVFNIVLGFLVKCIDFLVGEVIETLGIA